MITVEEAIKLGVFEKYSQPTPNFVISIISGIEADKNISLIDNIQDILNKKIDLSYFTNGLITNITFTFIRPYNGLGVKWKERKYYNKKEKKIIVDFIFVEYQEFCNADKETSLQILKRNLLRGVKKFLENQKDFNFIDFYTDLQKIL